MNTHRPYVLIVTLKVDENEFEQCRRRIRDQSYQHFDHLVIEDVPIDRAHQILFSKFIENEEYDLLVKVDADTVLNDRHALQRIVNDFRQHPRMLHIQYYLHDFLTDTRIIGLNCYRRGISVGDQDDLFTDQLADPEKSRRLRVEEGVIGDHSPDPSDHQAFRFGFRRQMKKKNRKIFQVLMAYLFSFHRKRELALAGAIVCRNGNWSRDGNVPYEEEIVERELTQAKRKSRIHLCFWILIHVTTFLPTYFWKFLLLVRRKLLGKIV